MMGWKRLLLGAFAAAVVGCGSGQKADVPKDLNKPLPPPPVAGGTGPAKKMSQPANTAD
jgi:hypothetical protein